MIGDTSDDDGGGSSGDGDGDGSGGEGKGGEGGGDFCGISQGAGEDADAECNLDGSGDTTNEGDTFVADGDDESDGVRAWTSRARASTSACSRCSAASRWPAASRCFSCSVAGSARAQFSFRSERGALSAPRRFGAPGVDRFGGDSSHFGLTRPAWLGRYAPNQRS